MGIIIDGALFRRLSGAGPTAAIVATLGLFVGLQGLAQVIYGGESRRLEPFLPAGTFTVFDLNVGWDQTVILGVSVAAALGLMVFFRWSHLGLQTRAVVDNRVLSELTGANAPAVTRFAWVLGCAFAATSGILFSATLGGVHSVLLTLLVVQAFGAAAVGRLQSFPLTVLAAFGLGVVQSVVTKEVGEWGISSLNGLPSALPTLLLFGAILFSGRRPMREAPTTRSPSRRRVQRTTRFPVRPVVGAVAVMAVLPAFFAGGDLLTLTSTVAFFMVFASLSLLVGLSRQLSLAHAIFVAFGAVGLAKLQGAGVPYLAALLLAGLILVPVGAVLAIPALRLSGLYLGLATLGFGILAQDLIFDTEIAFGSLGLVTIERPGFLAGDVAFYYFVVAIAVAGLVTIELVRVTRLGRILVALADSPTAVGALGISSLSARVVTFCLSAFFAGLAGGLLGSIVRSVNPNSFTFFHSLIWVTVLVVAGARTFGGILLASVLLVALPATFSASVVEWQPVVFGAAAIAFAQADNGLIGWIRGFDMSALRSQVEWRTGAERRLDRLARAGAR
jgi:ABC-type branched-subunit amino acid transport system permease subunit